LAGGFAGNAVQIGDADDVVTIGNDLTVTGDLIVSGDTVQQDVTKLTVEDPLIELARSNSANAFDIGFFGKYVDSGTKYAGLFRDASDGKFKLFKDTTVDLTGLTAIDTSGSGYLGATLVATLEGSSTSCTGNAATASALAAAVTIGGSSFDGSGAIVPQTITSAAASANANHYVPLFTAATGAQGLLTDAQLTYNPSSNLLTVPEVMISEAFYQTGRMQHGAPLDLAGTTAAHTLTWDTSTAATDMHNVSSIEVSTDTADGTPTCTITLPVMAANVYQNGSTWVLRLMDSSSHHWSDSRTLRLVAPGGGSTLNGQAAGTVDMASSGDYLLEFGYFDMGGGATPNWFVSRKASSNIFANVSRPLYNQSNTAVNALVRVANKTDETLGAYYSASGKVATVSDDGELACSGATLFTDYGGAVRTQTSGWQPGQASQTYVVDTNNSNKKDYLILVNTESYDGSAITLPDPTTGPGSAGRTIVVKDVGGTCGSHHVTIASAGSSKTIDGAADFDLDVNWGSVTFVSFGGGWYVM
jgi:hypothetical protein